jgi:hypothetical protein
MWLMADEINKSTCSASHHPRKPPQPHGNQVKLDQFWFTGVSQHPIQPPIVVRGENRTDSVIIPDWPGR